MAREQIYDFSSRADCLAGKSDLFDGYMCTAGDNKLVDRWGQVVADLSSVDACRREEALYVRR
jgi:hypothetical protein